MTLQVYGQPYQHSDCYILGTKDDLLRLANQLIMACSDESISENYFASDGEGYSVRVRLTTDLELGLTRLPYYDEMSEDNRKNVKAPWQYFYDYAV